MQFYTLHKTKRAEQYTEKLVKFKNLKKKSTSRKAALSDIK